METMENVLEKKVNIINLENDYLDDNASDSGSEMDFDINDFSSSL